MNNVFYKDYLNNINELLILSKNNNFKMFMQDYMIINIDNYISFLKDNLNINYNELIILIDLTIYNKKNKILFSKKDYLKNYQYFNNKYKEMFLYNYNNNIKYLSKYIKIKKRSFNELITHINNKKRIYSYFENINNTNISFYIPIILNLEESN